LEICRRNSESAATLVGEPNIIDNNETCPKHIGVDAVCELGDSLASA